MTLTHILVFALASLPFMWLIPMRWRPQSLLFASILALAWLLADDVLNHLDFMILIGTLGLSIAVWWIVQPPAETMPTCRVDTQTFLIIGIGILFAGLILTLFDRPSNFLMPIFGIAVATVGALNLPQLLPSTNTEIYKRLSLLFVVGLIVMLVILKIPASARFFSLALDRDEALHPTGITPLAWLGFSYIAFRLISVLFDFRAGRLPKDGMALRDFLIYVLFFPAMTAGPIDRVQRFIPELNQAKPLDSARLIEGTMRIMVGTFKKFVIADSLALVALNPTLVNRTEDTLGAWLLLYVYAFRIFFDFSGYSDVAIGIGRLYGITLPENFDRPYTQQNLQQFWQRWHITLSTWFRLYYFTPISRVMLRSGVKMPQWLMVIIAQISTMVLIGLWHGVTVNFVLWGLWHGIGLFIHKLILDNTRVWYQNISQHRWRRRFIFGISWLTTFHYVALGWVFFALPTPADSVAMLARLVGGR
ncbi:MAG: MBOAT family protein [Chloroflexi bacterium]|nr:MBOAT family protein [Chloroflexota bacterium]NOG66196.1 MBOAT family protein [Chloroflexota bacterium]